MTFHLQAATFLVSSLAFAQPAPVLDRDVFFGEVEIAGAQISPDGKFISFLKPYKGVRNIWVKKTAEPFSAAKPVTAEAKRPVGEYFWSRDSRFVLYSQDRDGDENFNIFAVEPAQPAPAGADMPPTRPLTDLKGVRVLIYAVPRNQPDVIYIGLNDRDKAWHDLYRLKLATGEKTLLRKNTDRIGGWQFDNKGELRLATRSAENGDTEILRADADKTSKIYTCTVLEACAPIRFDKDNKLVYLITNQGDARDLIELAMLDPATGQTRLVESDPQRRVDLGNAIFSEVTDELVATIHEDDRERIHWKNKQFEADYNWLKSKLGDMQIGFGSHTTDENLWILSASSDTEPGTTYLFDRKARKLDLQYKVRERIPREHLARMQPIRYESSDGLEIPAYLTLPKGVPAKNLPVVMLPHGGPWGRDSWGFNGTAQFLANRGYAVLQPNFRASTGYGKKFLNKGNGEWGRKMQDDITFGVKALVQKGIADPKRAGIMGGSYGGYATLAGVAFTPDVYAAAVSIVGPSNLMTLLDSIPPYWEAARKILYARMADPNVPEGKKRLAEMSPLNSAARIKTPLMVQQGANDPRVNKAESDQIVVALRDRGFPVSYLVIPDEGHGFARPVNRLASMIAAEQFLAKYLGGRLQEGGTPEAMARLKEVTVDPKTVILTKKVDAAAATGLPALAGKPAAGVDRYAAKVEAGGQSMKMDIESEWKPEGDSVVVTDKTKMPMGEVTEVAVLDGTTLALRKRTAQQGPISIDMEMKGNQATGSLKMSGQERKIDSDTGGPLFADGAGAPAVIASLPLAEGYELVYRNFDLMKLKPVLKKLVVAGSESVSVPAGTFEAYKVEVTSADGSSSDKTTYWVAKQERKTVKIQATIASMGGAMLTAELQK